MTNIKPNTVDEYIARFPEDVQAILQKIRETIKKAAPSAQEVISYQMPAYKHNGVLVYFAAYKNHIGFYPTASGIANFLKELSSYKGAKGSVQFPLNKQIPYALIEKITAFKLKENKEKLKTPKHKNYK